MYFFTLLNKRVDLPVIPIDSFLKKVFPGKEMTFSLAIYLSTGLGFISPKCGFGHI